MDINALTHETSIELEGKSIHRIMRMAKNATGTSVNHPL